jgi:hypothetical protein
MTLVIETGAGVPGADSYVTTSECTAIAAKYFRTPLQGSDAHREVALRRAWVFMAALDWKAETYPLFGGTIPQEAKDAQVVLARLEFQTEGTLSPDVTISGKKVLTQVGSLGWTPQGGRNTVEAARPVVTMAMDLLRPWLAKDPARDGGRTTFLERG